MNAAKPHTRTFRPGQLSYSFHVIGGRPPGMRDAYHALLKMPWWGAFGLIVGVYLFFNVLFGFAFLEVGGVANARPGSFQDAFFFSVQTMGTIGYGAMYPASPAANMLVLSQSIVGLLVTALATGIVFVRFSQTRGRVLFSDKVTIGPIDGVPTLTLRLGNERNNYIYDAEMVLTLVRKRVTAEGKVIYLSEELKLVRNRAPNLQQSWMMMHKLDDTSPLTRETPQSLAASEAELMVAISGVDQTSLQPVHGRCLYEHFNIVWGAQLADVLSELPNGDLVLDLRKFHAFEPTEATKDFPYPAAAASA